MVGALAGTWLVSGIPSMIYYGLQILSPAIFLPATVIISIISIATGSSWTTSATVGIALIGVGGAFDLGMVAGAVISGAYFGDKLSPMSDTTNLAPAGWKLTHIRYMTLTTIPTYITMILFIVLGLSVDINGDVNIEALLTDIEASFTISLWLFAVPVIVIGLIIRKNRTLNCFIIWKLLAGIFAILFQPHIINQIAGAYDFQSAYKGVMDAITGKVVIPTDNETLAALLLQECKMLGTIWLIICAMVLVV
jgi:NhaC family Na+:H+ antiporter